LFLRHIFFRHCQNESETGRVDKTKTFVLLVMIPPSSTDDVPLSEIARGRHDGNEKTFSVINIG
jgi:hypothetical protein